jgi:hypothetical protein
LKSYFHKKKEEMSASSAIATIKEFKNSSADSVEVEYVSLFLGGDGHFDRHSWLDGNIGNLPHDIRSGIQVEDSLVNAHLPAIECVRSLTARRLAHDQLQNLSRHADRTFDLQQFKYKVILYIENQLESKETLRFFSKALFLSSRQIFSSASTFLEVRVILILWI